MSNFVKNDGQLTFKIVSWDPQLSKHAWVKGEKKSLFFKEISLENKPLLRLDPMLRSKWITQNKLNSIFGVSLAHAVKSGMLLLLTYRPFVYVLWFLFLGLYRIPDCVTMCVSTSMCVSCAFPLSLFLIFVCPIPVCFFLF